MKRYLCNTCGTFFDEPHRYTLHEHIAGLPFTYNGESCPICSGALFTEADECPKCGDPKPARDTLCRPCRRSLLRRFTAFADCLTAEEEQQLDEWLDGSSITDRKRWN